MKLILKRAHAYLYVLAVGLLYYFLWPLLYYFSRKSSRYPQLNKVRRLLGWLSSAACGIFYHFEFDEPIDWRKTYIICPHHTSNLDITAMCILVKNNHHCFMGKEELLEGLVTGLFFRSVDIPVNRDSNISAFRAFKRAGEKLQQGYSAIIFPEGKIAGDYPPVLHEFKNGPFRLAIEQKVPIIPVSSLNTWKIFWDDGKEYGSRPGIVRFYVHKPIYIDQLTLDDADVLRDRVYTIISQKTSSNFILTIGDADECSHCEDR